MTESKPTICAECAHIYRDWVGASGDSANFCRARYVELGVDTDYVSGRVDVRCVRERCADINTAGDCPDFEAKAMTDINEGVVHCVNCKHHAPPKWGRWLGLWFDMFKDKCMATVDVKRDTISGKEFKVGPWPCWGFNRRGDCRSFEAKQ